MNIYLKKCIWILALIFCCIFLSESVNPKGAAVDAKEWHRTEEKYEAVMPEEKSGRYITIYIDESVCIQIDLILILECFILLFAFVLEKVR